MGTLPCGGAPDPGSLGPTAVCLLKKFSNVSALIYLLCKVTILCTGLLRIHTLHGLELLLIPQPLEQFHCSRARMRQAYRSAQHTDVGPRAESGKHHAWRQGPRTRTRRTRAAAPGPELAPRHVYDVRVSCGHTISCHDKGARVKATNLWPGYK